MALYHKYRPQTFSEVIGQEHITVPLIKAIDSGKINHAYLFSGPRGCGKTSSARIMARSINCTGNTTPSAEPCSKCESCLALAPGGGGSVDVIELDAASHGGVEDTRELRDRAFYAPAFSRYRVFIIDEAHMVSNAGFNSLLKIVEEPPEHLIFIFATTEPEKVIPTIRSRTHHYPFRLLSVKDMEKLLHKVLEGENLKIDSAALPPIIRAGGGSPRDTLSVLDQIITSSENNHITFEAVRQQLGITDLALLDDIVAALADYDGVTSFLVLEKAFAAGLDPRRFATDLLDRLRDLILLKTVPSAIEKGMISLAGENEEPLLNQVKNIGLGTLTYWADTLQDSLTKMRGTTSTRMILEITIAKMLLPEANTMDNTALLARIEKLESGTERQINSEIIEPIQSKAKTPPANSFTKNIPVEEKIVETETAPTSPNPPANSSGLDLASIRSAWPGIKNMVYQTDKVIGVMLSGASIGKFDGKNLVINHDSPALVKRLNEPRGVDNLTKAFTETFKQDFTINFAENKPNNSVAPEVSQPKTKPVIKSRKVPGNSEKNTTPSEQPEAQTEAVKELSSAEKIALLREQLGATVIDK